MTDAKGYVSAPAGEVKWHYTVPDSLGSKVSLLTIGGLQITGYWAGRWGEYFLAWAPLLQRDKERERALLRALAAGEDLGAVNARFDASQGAKDDEPHAAD